MPSVPYTQTYSDADRKYLLNRLGGGGTAQALGLGDALSAVVGDATFDLTAVNWAGAKPTSPEAAINRLATAFLAVLARIDSDVGVTGTDYEATLKP